MAENLSRAPVSLSLFTETVQYIELVWRKADAG